MNEQKMNILIPVFKSKNNYSPKIFPISEYVLYFDGCSKGNPGHSGIGAVLYKNNEEIWASCRYIGNNRTNNEAEYEALIMGLEHVIYLSIYNLTVCGDSLLIINQIIGKYKVKNSKLLPLYEKVMNLKSKLNYIEFNHVFRCDNKRADQLCNLAIDTMDDKVDISHFTELDDDWTENNIINTLLSKPNVNSPPRFFLPQIKTTKNK